MILPGATVGVLGGGQLGRMFTLQARTMGYGVVVLDPDPASPAGAVANRHLRASYDDQRALAELSASCAAITTEFENVPATALEILARSSLVRPPVEAVATSQDRIAEKTFLQSHGIPTARFHPVRDLNDLKKAVAGLKLPALLKTSRLGYDGKGQALVQNEEDAVRTFQRFGGVPCVLEERLALECELSVVLARGVDGDMAPFPVAENQHRNGILETSVVPARVPDGMARRSPRDGHRSGRRDGVRGRARRRALRGPWRHGCWSTKWHPGHTTAVTTRSMPAPLISSSSSSEHCADCPWPSRGCSRRLR